MIGKIVSHYKIVEKLGGGGMGVVYKAEDTKLKRTVALKFLPPVYSFDKEAKQRFINEAQAASALQQHNICTIHDVDETKDGQIFICMDCYEGETLKKKIERGQIKTDESIDIIVQVATGLQKAHEKGIIHRDIKPANIFITNDGVVKILDFGLAKLSGQTMMTKMGETVGTIAYMSPEQTRGELVDNRTDIWSLGVVLYEMLTRNLPFKGDYDSAMIYSILNEEPKHLTDLRTDVPKEFQQIIDRCLSKNPAERYQSIDELLDDLKKQKIIEGSGTASITIVRKKKSRKLIYWISGLVIVVASSLAVWMYLQQKSQFSETSKSIAVLPFVDMSPQRDQEYFCDGMTEELLNRLSSIKELKVPARTSVFLFKGKTEDISEIGKKLNVKTVLEGSIRKSGDQLRITAQLISVDDGYHIWSQTYNREMKDVFAIQDEISLAIVEALKTKLFPTEKAQLEKKYTENVEAYQLYLKGRFYWNKRRIENFKKAIDYYKLSISLDSNFTLPYAGIADAYNLFFDKSSFERAKYYAKKALEIDSLMPEALTSLAFATERNDWDFERAEYYYKKAIEINPNYPTAYQWYGIFLTFMGRFDEGIKVIEEALKLDPVSLQINSDYGGISLVCSGRIEEAIASLSKTLDLDSTFLLAHRFLGKAYEVAGFYDKAMIEYIKGIEDGNRKFKKTMIDAYDQGGWKGFVKANLLNYLDEFNYGYADKISYVAFNIALGYCRLRNKDKTIEWIRIMYDVKDVGFIQLKTDPRFNWIRNDTEFKEVLNKVF